MDSESIKINEDNSSFVKNPFEMEEKSGNLKKTNYLIRSKLFNIISSRRHIRDTTNKSF